MTPRKGITNNKYLHKKIANVTRYRELLGIEIKKTIFLKTDIRKVLDTDMASFLFKAFSRCTYEYITLSSFEVDLILIPLIEHYKSVYEYKLYQGFGFSSYK